MNNAIVNFLNVVYGIPLQDIGEIEIASPDIQHGCIYVVIAGKLHYISISECED